MHRTKVKIVEEALDANNTIARANRDDFDRARRHGRQLHERPRRRQDDAARARRRRACPACASACSRATCRARWTPTAWPSLHVPVTQLNTDPGFGGECHLDANMVRSALHELPLDEIDLLVIENVGNLVCPAEFRVGEDVRVMVVVGHRGRGQAAQVPADVPHLRPRPGQQDRPAAAPRLRPRQVPLQPRPRASRACSGCWSRARTGEGIDAWREWLRRRGAPGAGAGMRAAGARDALDALLDRRTEANERVLRRAGRAAGAALPPDGRALRAGRPAGGVRRARRRRAPTPATSRSSSSTR